MSGDGSRTKQLQAHEELVEALAPVASALRILGIPFYVGGSVASSFHGAARSTMDVDLVADLGNEHVTRFLQSIGDEFYASEVAIRDTIERKSSFNLIHLPTSFKVDVFLNKGRPFDQNAMSRAIDAPIGTARVIDVPVATPEDSIVSKLERFRLGNETSERQWRDVSKLVDLLVDQLDLEYLKIAAKSVGVDDLLHRLLDR